MPRRFDLSAARVVPALVLLAFAADGAQASGIGAPIVGTMFSGVTTRDPAAIHHNPAMLAGQDGLKLQLNAAFIYGNIRYRRERRALYQHEDGFKFALPLEESDIDLTKTGKAEPVSANVTSPLGSLFASYEVARDLSVGLGVYGAFGATMKMPDGGPQRFAAQEAMITGLYVTPAVAWRPVSWLRIGAGVSLVLGTLNLRQVADLATTSLLADVLADEPMSQPNDFGPDAPTGVRELEVLGRPTTVVTTALGYSFNVGLAVDPTPDWTIAAMYQHGADLVFEGDAALDMNHDFFTTDLAFKGLQYPPIVRGKAWVTYPFPAALRAGVAWRPDAGTEIAVQASWVMWSVLDAIDVTIESEDLEQPELGLGPRTALSLKTELQDTIEAEASLSLELSEDLRIGARAGYHSPFSRDSRVDISTIDGHRLIAGFIVDFAVADAARFAVQAGVQHVLDREVASSIYDRGNGTYGLTIAHAGATLSLDL